MSGGNHKQTIFRTLAPLKVVRASIQPHTTQQRILFHFSFFPSPCYNLYSLYYNMLAVLLVKLSL